MPHVTKCISISPLFVCILDAYVILRGGKIRAEVSITVSLRKRDSKHRARCIFSF